MRENLVITENLSRNRTHLANERTLLAYVRTGLAIDVVGGFVLVTEHSSIANFFAGTMMTIGLLIVAIGIWRFIKCKRKIQRNES